MRCKIIGLNFINYLLHSWFPSIILYDKCWCRLYL